MVISTLTSHFGKTLSSIARDVRRLDVIIGRESHLLAGFGRNYFAGEELPYVNSHGITKCDMGERGTVRCQRSLRNQLDVQSIFATALPSAPDTLLVDKKSQIAPDAQVKRIRKEFSFLERCRRGAKGFLNATTNPTSRTFKRKFSMLTLEPIILPRPRQPYRTKINNRLNCAEWCGTDPCELSRKENAEKASMWISPNCFNKLVCKRILRHDIVHMPGSNKATREYQQTWVECPPIRVVPKPVCCTEPMEPPPICRRPRKVRPPTAIEFKKGNFCNIKNKKCPKVEELPCCHIGRDPPSCKIFPTPKCCQKRCTPFPSFSECCKPDPNPKRPVECYCLVRPTLCEVWANWRKQHLGMH